MQQGIENKGVKISKECVKSASIVEYKVQVKHYYCY